MAIVVPMADIKDCGGAMGEGLAVRVVMAIEVGVANAVVVLAVVAV